jgi:hypothetical protein
MEYSRGLARSHITVSFPHMRNVNCRQTRAVRRGWKVNWLSVAAVAADKGHLGESYHKAIPRTEMDDNLSGDCSCERQS